MFNCIDWSLVIICPMTLLNLVSDVLSSIFVSWLKIEDMALLDTAVCNEKLRAEVFSPGTTYFHDTTADHDSMNYHAWLTLRSVIVRSFNLSNYVKHGLKDSILNLLSKAHRIDHLSIYLYNLDEVFTKYSNSIESIEVVQHGDLSDENFINSFLTYKIQDLRKVNIFECSNLTEVSIVTLVKQYKILESLCVPVFCSDILVHCEKLTELQVFESISNENIRRIADTFNISLKALRSMTVTDLDDETLNYLSSKCRNLEHFALCSDTISDVSVLKLAQNCVHLTNITLNNAQSVTDESLVAFSTHCKTLIRFSAVYCSQVTDIGVCKLVSGCAKLTFLSLDHCTQLTDTAICAMAEHCPDLQTFTVRGCFNVTDDSMRLLSEKCLDLSDFDVNQTAVTSASLVLFARDCGIVSLVQEDPAEERYTLTLLPKRGLRLFDMDIHYTPLTAQSFTALVNSCPHMRTLTIRDYHELSDTEMYTVVDVCTQLEVLSLTNTNMLSPDVFTRIATDCVNLYSFSVDCTAAASLTDAFVALLVQNKRNMSVLQLCNCALLTDVSVYRIAQSCPLLREVKITHNPNITDTAVTSLLQGCRFLHTITLSHCSSAVTTNLQNNRDNIVLRWL